MGLAASGLNGCSLTVRYSLLDRLQLEIGTIELD